MVVILEGRTRVVSPALSARCGPIDNPQLSIILTHGLHAHTAVRTVEPALSARCGPINHSDSWPTCSHSRMCYM